MFKCCMREAIEPPFNRETMASNQLISMTLLSPLKTLMNMAFLLWLMKFT